MRKVRSFTRAGHVSPAADRLAFVTARRCRYTLGVNRMRRHGVALVVAFVLAGLPLSSTVCLALCAPSTSSAAHETHGGGHHDHHSTNEFASQGHGQPALAALDGHRCLSHPAQIGKSTEALVAVRADAAPIALAPALGLATSAVIAPSTLPDYSDGSPPPASSTRAPLVLRI